MKKIKVIKIDVVEHTITFVEIEQGFQPIYDAIGNNCEMMECPLILENGDSFFCDEEALLREKDIVGGASIKGIGSPIIGNILVIGSDSEGESINCKSSLGDIKKKIIQWISKDMSISYAKSIVG